MTCNCWHGLIISDTGDVSRCNKCNHENHRYSLPNSVRIVCVELHDCAMHEASSMLIFEKGKRGEGAKLAKADNHILNALGYDNRGYFFARREPSGRWAVLNRVVNEDWAE